MSKEAKPPGVVALEWIIEDYARRMSEVLEKREASPARYEEEFAECCEEAFERFRLTDCGYSDLEAYMAEFGPAFADYFEANRRSMYHSGEGSVDVADFLRWEEETIHLQKTSTEDKQTMWDVSLELHKDAIPESAEYQRRIMRLAMRLRQKGLIPRDVRDDELHTAIWGIVYEAIVQETGPATLKEGTTNPRTLDDVIGFGHLSNKLRTEFRDGRREKDAQQRTDRMVHHDRLDDVEELAGDDDPTAAIEAAEAEERLRREKAALLPQDLLLLEAWADGRPQREIAEQLGVSQPTVSNRLKRLFAELKERLAE